MQSDQPQPELGAADPTAVPPGTAQLPDLTAAPVEPTTAISSLPAPEAASAADQLVNLLVIGGPVVWILLVMSSIAITIVLLKLWQLRATALTSRRGLGDQGLELWRRGQQPQAVELLAGDIRPLPALLHFAMVGMRAGTAIELLREEVARIAICRLEELRSHLKTLEIIASLSPLLGLFGTVIGMIEAFSRMEQAGSQVDPSVLSGGIWVALLTTAVGLAVAMPTVMAHAWLERKVDGARHRIEDALTQVFTHQVVAEEPTARLVPIGKRHAPA